LNLLLLLLLGAPQPAAVPAKRVATWESRWEESACLIGRHAEAPSGAVFFIERTPASEVTGVNFVDPAWKKASAKDFGAIELVLEPGGVERAETIVTVEDAKLSLWVKDRALLGRLASAATLSLRNKKGEIARASLGANAIEALRACERDALVNWGIDPVQWEALRSPPIGKVPLASIISHNDYPMDALRDGASGKVFVRLQINAAGKVESCKVVVSGGHHALDRTTCDIARRRASFHPAIDSEGRPVAAPFVTAVTWRVFS
jgi:TonB family protein